MKKTVILCAVVLALVMLTACKSGTQNNVTVFENEFNDSMPRHLPLNSYGVSRTTDFITKQDTLMVIRSQCNTAIS